VIDSHCHLADKTFAADVEEVSPAGAWREHRAGAWSSSRPSYPR